MRYLTDLFAYTDTDDSIRTRKLLMRILLVYAALGFVQIAGVFIFDPSGVGRTVLSLITSIMALGLIVPVHLGYTRAVSWFLVVTLWAMTFTSFVIGGGIRTAGYSIFLPVILSIFLLGRNVGLAVTILTIAAGLVLTLIETHTDSLPPPRVFEPLTYWVSQSLVILLIALIVEIASNSTRWALGRAKAAEENWRMLAQNTPDYIIEIHADHTVRFLNRAMTGLPPEAAIGKPLDAVLPPEIHADTRILADEVVTTQQTTQAVCPFGDKHYQILATPILERDRLEVVCITIRDVTIEVIAQEQAVQLALETEKNAMLETFISEMSHDFKTPLSTIMISADLAARYPDAERRHEKLNNIQEQAAALNRSIQNLLTMTRMDHSERLNEPFNLNVVVERTVRDFDLSIQGKHLTCATDLAADLPDIQGDSDQVGQALANLVENAVRYTADGGRISVRTYVCDGQTCLEVADTGIGIQTDDLDKIFQRFFRTANARSANKSGTGLGLTIVQRVMQSHDGEVSVQSTPGSGTTFTLRFPG
jgi:PAS domain S-box-containing protein